MNLGLKVLLISLSTLLLIVVVLVGEIPREHYAQSDYYFRMQERLDSLERHWQSTAPRPFRAGWSRVPLIPDRPVPMAGYGARDPKEFQGVADSVYVRTIVFDNGGHRAAWLSADLLVVHPEVANRFFEQAADLGWGRHEIFFSATHTHASIGAWAPGLVGKLFAGPYDESMVQFVADRMIQSLQEAQNHLRTGALSYNELQVPELVKNRLVRERGVIDPWLKILGIQSGEERGYASIYSAHATSLSHRVNDLSGGFPGRYNDDIVTSTSASFSLYAAGAVGSMGPRVASADTEFMETDLYAQQLSENVALLELLDPEYERECQLSSFRLTLDLPDPMMKINRSQGLRPWLFERLTGEYKSELSVLLLGDVVVVGVPCDFSGELAVRLYQYARDLGLHLVITSFNGGYNGYVIKDDWYDEKRYESRVMSWYGPHMGAYYTDIIQRVLGVVAGKRK